MDELWQLEDDRHPRPQWSTWGIPDLANYDDLSSEEDDDGAPRNVNGAAAGRSKGKSKKQKNVRPDALVRKKRTQGRANPHRMAIMDDDIPHLTSCSSTSSDVDTDFEEDGGEKNSDTEWGSDVESDYDSREKKVLERLMKEAQDATSAAWTSGTGRKDSNPYIRLLSNLRGTFLRTIFDCGL